MLAAPGNWRTRHDGSVGAVHTARVWRARCTATTRRKWTMRAQATVEGIDHVVRNGSSRLYETHAPGAMAPPNGDVVTADQLGVAEPVRIEPARWSVMAAGAFATFASLGIIGM